MGKSLMIVDDSATMRKIIRRAVRVSGLRFDRTEEAGGGVEALEKLQADPVDVVLCGINMPGMDGMELVRQVRQMPSCRATKIVMVSAESSEEYIMQVIGDGADGYLTKPFTPEMLRRRLTPLLN